LFGFQVPLSLAGVDPKLLTPRETWTDPTAYDTTAEALVGMFEKNFAKYESLVDAEVRNARPGLKSAAAA
jgi:phosphoenolpyruvate carboxykinase (ATP)